MNMYSMSDTGEVRNINQDSYKNLELKNGSLMIVADGMGGHNAGEIASKMAIEIISEFVEQNFSHAASYSKLLEDAIGTANYKIFKEGNQNQDQFRMGTTVVCVLIVEDVAHFAHVGDSRGYIKNKYGFRQITKDHSLVSDLLRTGTITEDEAKNYSHRNVITRALGIDEQVKVDSISLGLTDGSILLLCTDGLTNELTDDKIDEVVSMEIPVKDMVEMLTYMANASGGYDNITISIYKYTEVNQ